MNDTPVCLKNTAIVHCSSADISFSSSSEAGADQVSSYLSTENTVKFLQSSEKLIFWFYMKSQSSFNFL